MVKGKVKVGIVFGGISSEKEISLESGRNVFIKIDRSKFEPFAIFMDSKCSFWELPIKLLMKNTTLDIEDNLEENANKIFYEELKKKFDILFISLHGKYGEDGCLQGLCELISLPYTGSGVLASAITMNKYFSRKILTINKISVPNTICISQNDWEKEQDTICIKINKKIGFPCIIKPIKEGCSTAVQKVQSTIEINKALNNVFKWDSKALIEEFIVGTEITCGVIGYKDILPLIPSETLSTKEILSLEDKFLYGQGQNKTPARVNKNLLKKIQEIAVKTFLVLDLQIYARIDMFIKKDEDIIVLEANTLPALTPSTVLFHQAAELMISQTEFITRIINLSLKAHSEKKGPL